MKVSKMFLLVFLALLAGNSFSQNIYISTERDLNFGDFYISGTAGATVSISDTGQRSSSGNVKFLNETHHSVTLLLSTDSPTPIQVLVETPASVMTNTEGRKMSIQLNSKDNFIYTLQEGFPKHIPLGGVLTLDPEAGMSPGDYNGSVLITVIILNE